MEIWRRARCLIMVAVVGLLAGCATTGPGINIFSVEQEIQMGRQFSREINQQVRIVQDPLISRYIQELGLRLVSAEASRTFPYRFYVIEEREVNAFAVPGGYVYINSGLITAADNEAELASVVAHEIGHVVRRHSTQQLTAQYGYSMLASLLMGQNPAQWQALAANLVGVTGFLAYSRGHESDADQYAVETLYRSGYDARAMISFFEKLKSLQRREPGLLERFFSSHPAPSERIARIGQLIRARPAQVRPLRDTAYFAQVKERLTVTGPSR